MSIRRPAECAEAVSIPGPDSPRRHRSCGRCRPHPAGVCERTGQADQDAAEQTRGPAAGDRGRGARPATATGRQPAALPERVRRLPRLPELQPSALEARPESSRDRAAARPLRPAPHLRHLRAPCRGAGVRSVTVHGYEHRDDRPPLRPSRGRQPRARRLAPRCTRARAGRGRWVDVARNARNAAYQQGFEASPNATPEAGGRSVDVEPARSVKSGNRNSARAG